MAFLFKKDNHMHAPTPPSLAEFGLTEEKMTNLPKRYLDSENESNLVRFALGGSLIFAGEVAYTTHSILLGLLSVFFLPLGMIGGVITLFILGALEKAFLKRKNENFRRACLYWDSLALYRKKRAEYEAWLAKTREEFWRSLSGVAFEKELGGLFKRMGYQVHLTSATGDGGVDLILKKNNKITVVQCKAHNKKIPIGVARELRSSMLDFHANEAIIACFEGVTQPVKEYIKDKPITVLDIKDIVALQKKCS